MTNEEIAIKQHLRKPRPSFNPCCCLGPRGDDPRCLCMMQMVENVDGEWYEIEEIRSETGISFLATKI
jgi:hypothetical protein